MHNPFLGVEQRIYFLGLSDGIAIDGLVKVLKDKEIKHYHRNKSQPALLGTFVILLGHNTILFNSTAL